MAVLALGKLGGREMTIGSDLDLIFVYDAPGDLDSDGPKPLPAGLYFGRWSQRLITGLTVRTAEGTLYDVDMRLRPSGNKGPIASNLDGFVRYQSSEAWTWEHMALTRARAIAGPPALMQAADAAVRGILTQPRDARKLVADVADMRRRMAREHPGLSPWDVKHRRGGMVDIEFIVQMLQLVHGGRVPAVRTTSTLAGLVALHAAGLLTDERREFLERAYRLLRSIEGRLRLLDAADRHDFPADPDGQRQLAHLLGYARPDELVREVQAVTARTRAEFERIFNETEAAV